MNKIGKSLVWLTIIMFISFIISGFFFLKSGLINFGTGEVNQEVLIEIDQKSYQFNEFFGIPTDYENCYLDWCSEESNSKNSE